LKKKIKESGNFYYPGVVDNISSLPLIVAGDLNSIPESSVYKLLETGYVDIHSHDDFCYSKKKTSVLFDYFPKAIRTLTNNNNNENVEDGICKVNNGQEGEREEEVSEKVTASMLQHPFNFTNVYSGVYQTPTTFTKNFSDTIDYIWVTKDHFKINKIRQLPLQTFREDGTKIYHPSEECGSDHLPLMAHLSLTL